MFAFIPFISVASRRARRLMLAFGVAVVLAVTAGVLGAQGAQARGFAPTTVRNFCQLDSGLGRYYYGRSNGDIYAYWTLGTRYMQYIGFDTNGDSHLDVVAYLVDRNGQTQVADIGWCDPYRDWLSAATIERRLQQREAASNEAWGEMGPGLEWSGEMNAMVDAFG